MRIADFGSFSDPVVLFGGAVSNAHAVKAMLADLDALGLGDAPLISTGDHVAYCADVGETLALLRARRLHSIAGNCEESLGAGADDCGCGFAAGTVCDRASLAWFAHADRVLAPADRAWMAGLPRLATFRAFGKRWGVVHGGARIVNRFLWPTDPETVLAAEIAAFEAAAGPVDAILAGHCGVPFARLVGERLWLNTGALGMPAHDGDARVSYVILRKTGPDLRRIAYDWQGQQAAMRAAGLVQGYETTLETGWWPSEDVLPPELRRAALHRSRPARLDA